MQLFPKILSIQLIFILFFLFNSKLTFASESIFASLDPARDEVLKGPWTAIDAPYWTYPISNQPMGFITTKNSVRRTAQTLEPKITSFLDPSWVIKTPIRPTAFDSRGRWFQGIYNDGTGVLRGFYHAEGSETNPCDNISGVKSIAYAESSDGGKTWVAPNYPNNQIIKGLYPAGAGDFQLREFDNYLYLYYYEHACGTDAPSQGTAVARAPIASKGKPGSWTKYYCEGNVCGFGAQSGLGGEFTRLSYNNLRGVNMCTLAVSWNEYLGKYISPACVDNRKVIMVTSSDLVNWYPILPVLEVPPMQSTSTLLAYRNTISLSGSAQKTGQKFWLYYIGVTRSGSNQGHILYRQKVTLNKSGSISPTQTPTPSTTPKKGDANNDGQVNDDDLIIWKLNLGKSAPPWPTGNNQANFNLDNIVDGHDYLLWYKHYGT